MGDEVEEVAVAEAAEVVRALQALAAAPVEVEAVEVQVPRAVMGLQHPPLLAAAAGMVPAPADGALV